VTKRSNTDWTSLGSDPVIAHYDISAVVNVVLTDSARELLARIRAQRSGSLSLVIGNGCCDSTTPFLFEAYVAGPNEARVGELAGDVEVLLDRALLRLFEGREIVIDAADAGGGPGEDSFSCESELGMRFSLDRLPQPS
jgi:uncharacterized protein (DUF779 family)